MQFQLPINLDDMSLSIADYSNFQVWLTAPNSRIGKRTCSLLYQYVTLKKSSMYYRSIGHIWTAKNIESEMQAVYKALPQKYQW